MRRDSRQDARRRWGGAGFFLAVRLDQGFGQIVGPACGPGHLLLDREPALVDVAADQSREEFDLGSEMSSRTRMVHSAPASSYG